MTNSKIFRRAQHAIETHSEMHSFDEKPDDCEKRSRRQKQIDILLKEIAHFQKHQAPFIFFEGTEQKFHVPTDGNYVPRVRLRISALRNFCHTQHPQINLTRFCCYVVLKQC